MLLEGAVSQYLTQVRVLLVDESVIIMPLTVAGFIAQALIWNFSIVP